MLEPVEEAEGAIVMVADWTRAGELLSATVTMKLDAEVEVGVPEMTPEEARERPAGSCPAVIVHTYGAVPPTACRLCR